MRKVLTFQFSALGTRSFVADQDYLIQDATVAGGVDAVLSFNPSQTSALAKAPTTNETLTNQIAYKQSGNSSPQTVPAESMKVPLDAGSTLYVAASGIGAVFVYLDTVGDSVSFPS